MLDYQRLGKQRVEAKQLIDTILDRPTKSGKPRKGWVNHPAVRMWRNYPGGLQLYYNLVVIEWIDRGYKNTMQLEQVQYPVVMPVWLGDEKFHASHRSNLLRKDPEHYSQFRWTESPDLEYIWPS